MSEKIDVKSGDPYRADGGKFGSSPDQKLKDSIAALQEMTLVTHDENRKKVKAALKEAKAKLAALRSGQADNPTDTPTDTTGWKASGTEEEANAFSKNSAFKDTLYHGTSQTAGSKIEKGGFDVSKKAKRGETNFPGAIMLTTSQEDAVWYGKRAGGDDGIVRPYSVLSMKINTAKHKKFTDAQWDKARGDKPTEDFIKELFQEYDSFEIQEPYGSKTLDILVKDPKSIMVFNNDKH